MLKHKRRVDRRALVVLPVGDLTRERKTNPAYALYFRNALRRFDLERITEADRQHGARMSGPIRGGVLDQEPSH